MAIYKIFPEKSATLYSFYPTLNSGIDEILELSTFESVNGTNEVSRPLIKFSNTEINDIITNKVTTSSFKAYLKSYLAYSTEIPLSYTIYSHPLASDWNVGTGRLSNSPITTDGVSWNFTNELSGSVWFTSGSFLTGTTGSYRSGSTDVGGGLWLTSSVLASSQSFSYTTPPLNLDINLDITNTVSSWFSSSISNYGIILKHSSSLEFTTASKFETKYYSANTHMIFPPCLEIRWDDSVYTTGSQSVATSSLYVISLGNNKNEYQQDSVQRFQIKVRDKYPSRTFSTSSFSYAMRNYALPSSSYWSIKDLDTEEIVVDYDETYTKISCNSNGNFFDIYFNGLQPERHYKLLIKTVFDSGETIVFDENYYFKVKR